MARPRSISPGADLSPGAGESIGSYISHYREAVEIQARRVLRKRASPSARRIDAVWLVVALDNLRTAVEFAKTKMATRDLREPVRAFKRAIPDLDKARDVLMHFDTWRAGVGRGQERAADGTWTVAMTLWTDLRDEPRQGRIVVRLSHQSKVDIDLPIAVEATRSLAAEAERAIDRYVKDVAAGRVQGHRTPAQ